MTILLVLLAHEIRETLARVDQLTVGRLTLFYSALLTAQTRTCLLQLVVDLKGYGRLA